MNRPQESRKSKIINVVIPSLICLVVFLTSLYLDMTHESQQMFWMQRAGSIITILGAWIAFHESRESMKIIDGNLFIETKLPYRYIALIMVFIGTILWGYGDIPFK